MEVPGHNETKKMFREKYATKLKGSPTLEALASANSNFADGAGSITKTEFEN